MAERPLTAEDLEHYRDRGYVVLREAFPRAAASRMEDFVWERLRENVGIDREDRSTWRQATWRLNRSGGNSVYDDIGSPRMFGAFDQILGEGSWDPPTKWGGFLVTFPRPEPTEWGVTADQWHWDGNPAAGLTGKPRGLFVFNLISEVRPMGGGTLIASGSHRLIHEFFKGLPPHHRRRQAPLKKQFSQSHPYWTTLSDTEDTGEDRIAHFMAGESDVHGVAVRVVEATGGPGDAYICHPDIYHAKSMNVLDSPRFMRAGGPKPRSNGNVRKDDA